MNTYEAKQEARKERLENAADRAKAQMNLCFEASHKAVANIPMGQPILVGHHSERGHRAALARSDAQMRKGCEAHDRAIDLARKAKAVGNGGVSSDDPEAVQKLQAELVKLEKSQALMVAANKLVKKSDRAGLLALGFSEGKIEQLFTKDCFGNLGFPGYATTNNGANIRRIKARIEELKTKAEAPEHAAIIGEGFRIVEDKELNRVCVEFDAIPSEAVRAELKSHGFRWSPSRGAWLRQTSNQAWYWAEQATK